MAKLQPVSDCDIIAWHGLRTISDGVTLYLKDIHAWVTMKNLSRVNAVLQYGWHIQIWNNDLHDFLPDCEDTFSPNNASAFLKEGIDST